MLSLRFVKAPPTTYVIHHARGRVVREGAGLSFFYISPLSTIVMVPLESVAAPFAIGESTSDFQQVTIQGQLTYRVSEPKKLAAMLDFSLTPTGRHATDDPQHLLDRLVQATQALARAETQSLPLREALVSAEALGSRVLAGLKSSETVARLGVEVLGLSILSIRPTPEMAKALEADAREALLRRSDEAIYERRNAAVEQERRIRQSELDTDLAVESMKRRIRESQMAADIALEQQRASLIDQRVENDRKDADGRAYSLEAVLKPVRGLDWRTLMMLFGEGRDPRTVIAMAFQEMASNAQKIGELNVSPELLHTLISAAGK